MFRVIRLNPDTIIYDETRLRGFMAQPSVHGVFSNCALIDCNRRYQLMTDFLAFRPIETNYSKWFENNSSHSESWCSSVFEDMVRNRKVGWIQRYSKSTACRIAQRDIGHTHEKWTAKLDYIIEGQTPCPEADYKPCGRHKRGLNLR